jgi:hypothetical protein
MKEKTSFGRGQECLANSAHEGMCKREGNKTRELKKKSAGVSENQLSGANEEPTSMRSRE